MGLSTPGNHNLKYGLKLIGVPSSEIDTIATELLQGKISDKVLGHILKTHQNIQIPHSDDSPEGNVAYDNIVGALRLAQIDTSKMFEHAKRYFQRHNSTLPSNVEQKDHDTGIENLLECYGLAHNK